MLTAGLVKKYLGYDVCMIHYMHFCIILLFCFCFIFAYIYITLYLYQAAYVFVSLSVCLFVCYHLYTNTRLLI